MILVQAGTPAPIADATDFTQHITETESQEKVKSAGVFVQELIDELGVYRKDPYSCLPWDKTHPLFRFRPGEVTLWAGVNGQGKSLVTGLAALSLCTQEQKVCIASFEMKPKRTLERMCRQWVGQAAPMPHEIAVPEILAAFRDTYEQFRDWANSYLWLYDQQGTVKTDMFIGVVRYCAKVLGIKHFFIDSLMKCVANEDDYNGQKTFVDELTAIARDYGMHIHLIHHIKKLGSEDDVPDKMDVKGSGSIADQVDNILIMWRNKKKERESQMGKKVSAEDPDALLICNKQRNGEWEGRIGLWYDKASQQFVGTPGQGAMDFYGGFPHRTTK